MPVGADPSAEFLGILGDCLEKNTLVKLALGKYRGDEPGLERITIRRVMIKGQPQLCFVEHYQTRDITKNYPVEAGIEHISKLMGPIFKSADLFSLVKNVRLEFNKKGISRLTQSRATHLEIESDGHDNEKQRYLDQQRPFLKLLGITGDDSKVLPSMSRKWKQINKFLEVFDHALGTSELAGSKRIEVVDFGAGKGYLTFAIHDYLCNTLKVEAQVTGVELRNDLVRFCADTAEKLKSEGLSFRQGDIENYTPMNMNVLIALHACDTATDLAIHLGIRSGAGIIMCAPCCHKQIRPQINAPDVLKPLLRFGVHMAQEADMVTDGLRVLLMEACGYEVKLFEFISLEHTDKNKMILGIKRPGATANESICSQIEAIKKFYGIQEHKLESLLRSTEG